MNNNSITQDGGAKKRLAYKLKEAAEQLGLSESTTRRLVYKNRLRAIPGIRHILIPASEIERLLSVR